MNINQGLEKPSVSPEAIEAVSRPVFEAWSSSHAKADPHIGVLPYNPQKYPDQSADVAYRKVNTLARWFGDSELSDSRRRRAAIFLPGLAYLKAYEGVYAVSVGRRTARNIISSIENTPAFDGPGSPSIIEHIIDTLKTGQAQDDGKKEKTKTLGFASGHIGRYADIADFIGGASIAVARQEGFKYMDQLGISINKNMTYESYDVLKRIPVPIPIIGSLAFRLWYGLPPGESADQYGATQEMKDYYNGNFVREFMKARHQKSQTIGFVPTGSGQKQKLNKESGKIEAYMGDPSFTASLARLCSAGIIVADHVGGEVRMSRVIDINDTSRQKPGRRDAEPLMDDVMDEIADHTRDLTGLSVNYVKLSPEKHSARLAA